LPLRAFTLVELLVVITILLLLSSLALAVFHTGRSSDRMRSASRVVQSAFLGARDRAQLAKDQRGVRLVRDTTDPTLATGFVYVQPLPLQTAGNTLATPSADNVAVTTPPAGATATLIVISGPAGAAWFQQDRAGIWPPAQVQVRIPSSQSTAAGPWLQLQRQSNTPPCWGTQDASGNLNLVLQTPSPSGPIPATDSRASIDVQLGNDLLPFHQPISLSSGCVIDLARSSANVQTLAGVGTGFNPPVDVMFSPRGQIAGSLQGLGPLHFLLRDLRDAAAGLDPTSVAQSQQARGDLLVLTVVPQTGLVQVFEADPTDAVNNATGAPGADGVIDDLFHFAKIGSAAGR
jgi:prepilin-type N-terminal cleavage/methylation domain-containing protein